MTHRRHACGYCGKVRPTPDLIRSRHTGIYYCGSDFKACERRAARRLAQAERESAGGTNSEISPSAPRSEMATV
jgi:hypothetical protein